MLLMGIWMTWKYFLFYFLALLTKPVDLATKVAVFDDSDGDSDSDSDFDTDDDTDDDSDDDSDSDEEF